MTDITELNERALEDILSKPSEATKEILAGLDDDIVVLGAGGKMGPTISMMLKRASSDKKIYAVSRFSDEVVQSRIEDAGIETVQIDLLDDSLYSQLPDVKNVFFLAGMKFGSTGNQPTATSAGCNLEEVSRACGIPYVDFADNLTAFKKSFESSLKRSDPSVIVARINDAKPVSETIHLTGSQIRDRFVHALNRQGLQD